MSTLPDYKVKLSSMRTYVNLITLARSNAARNSWGSPLLFYIISIFDINLIFFSKTCTSHLLAYLEIVYLNRYAKYLISFLFQKTQLCILDTKPIHSWLTNRSGNRRTNMHAEHIRFDITVKNARFRRKLLT